MRAARLTPATVATERQRIALRLLALFGWHVEFAALPEPRGIIIVYPHTSNWDFPIGLLARWAIGLPLRWLGKEALFSGPAGMLLAPLLRAWGGEPVERGAATGAIERLAERIRAAPWYWLALAPEGTRKYRDTWRSGFYHIALSADVPLLAVSIDYATRTVSATTIIRLTGDPEVDRAALVAAYAGRSGYRPENAAPIVWK